MRSPIKLSIAYFVAYAVAQNRCRFPNGTLLPDKPEWNVYQPCSSPDGPTTMCCALARSNPPYSNMAQGFTQDQCLPNGLCLNGITTNAGEQITTYFVDYCTEYGQADSVANCVNPCSRNITARMTPCDGTKNSTRWCCGRDKDCCVTGAGVVSLEQVLDAAASTTTSSVSDTATSTQTTTSTTSQTPAFTSTEASSDPGSGPRGFSEGAIAGIVIGAVAGLACMVAAVLFYLRKASRAKRAGYDAPPAAENLHIAEAPADRWRPAAQEMASTSKHTQVAEMPAL